MVTDILPLRVEKAEVTKQGKTILGPVSFNLEHAGFTVIIGPNGSGKSTLLRLLHGLERAKSGQVKWNCAAAQARQHQAFVFQTPVMLRRSVIENALYPLRLKGMSTVQALTQAREWLERTGLSGLENRHVQFLSGGERQKLALARALAANPQVLFLDEPTTNLDGRATRDIEVLLTDAVKAGIRVVMATHDTAQARRLASDLLFLYRGKVHESNPATVFFKQPTTQEARAFLRGDILE